VIKVIAKNAVGISLPSADSAPVTPALLAMSMVKVGNAGNAADAGSTYPGYGAVSYSYQIGAYDVTGSQYTEFLNAVGSTDTYGLYNADMATDTNVAQISQSGSSGSYTYAVLNSTGSRPISYVSWFDSARFSNWMSNGQPTGAQTSTTTENGTYNVNGATTGNAMAANTTNPNTLLAPTFRIPTENEWYKAAYYSPNYGGSSIGGYYRYATQSNSAPGTTIGSSPNQANYNSFFGQATDVGSYSGSGSFYGTFDQSGNVYQWNDLDGTAGSSRGLRGGGWIDGSNGVSSSSRSFVYPSHGSSIIGFRLASPVTTTLNPTFGSTTATADGFTVPITNYDSSYTWAGTATASGLVAISGTGLVTVTGVAANTSSTATITTTRPGYTGGSATVTATAQPTTTSYTFNLTGMTDGGDYAQSFSYTGINNGYTVELISGYSSVNLYSFKTYNSNNTLATGISWSGTTTSNNYSVTMTATTTETNVNGYFTFDATLPGIITSYNVYDGTTLLGSGQKST